MLRDSLGRRGVWERLDTWICRVESLPCSPETITTLLISYGSTQNKEFFKKEGEIQLKKKISPTCLVQSKGPVSCLL